MTTSPTPPDLPRRPLPRLLRRLLWPLQVGAALVRLPTARLSFHTRLDPEHIRATYAGFTRPHPRYKLFPAKALGAALVHLGAFASPEDYLRSVRQRGHAGAQSRKAQARGYRLDEIDRNRHADEIHAINTSLARRQGRPMDRHYLDKQTRYVDRPHYRYFGVFDAHGCLSAYCDLGYFGNFALADRLLGYHNQDGAMYLLLKEIICALIAERRVEYLMYDTFFGASPGLREFKRRNGFRPYRVRYRLDSG